MGRRTREWSRRLVAIVLLTLGAVLTAEPVATTMANDRQAQQAAGEYDRHVRQAEPAELRRQLERARAYNASLPATLLTDPWSDVAGSIDGAAHNDYLQQLDTAQAMARIRIPAIGIDLAVHHDANDATLARAAGHMYGSALPVGGLGSHSVLAAHTGWRGATFFDRLPELEPGQTFTVDASGESLTYRIDDVSIVESWDLSRVRAVPGRDLITLVTCITPLGEDKQRLLVRGERVPAAVPATGAGESVFAMRGPGVQPWMWPRLLITAGAMSIGMLAAIRWFVQDRRRRREAAT